MTEDDRRTADVPEEGGSEEEPGLGEAETEAQTDAERQRLLGGDEVEAGEEGEEALPPPVVSPVRTFVIGLAAVLAVLVAVFVIYRYVFVSESTTETQPTTQPAEEVLRPIGPQFNDVTVEARLMVSTRQGDDAGVKRYICEAKGGGIAFLDYDNDGRLDIYVVNAGSLARKRQALSTQPSAAETPQARAPAPHRPEGANYLMRNRGDGTFEDVTVTAGVGDTGFGMGVCAGDFDNDGHIDIYVTNLGPNVLYRNRGDGTFEDVTEKAGVAGNAYSVSATFLDYDLDGNLDLFVGNYVDLDLSAVKPLAGRWKGGQVFFGPRGLKGVPDVLYRNNGDGTFTDVSADSGIASVARRSLGVVAGDADGDGRPDILVACDRQPNAYYHNLGDGRFEEIGLQSGLAYGEGGLAYGAQGIDLADVDNDLRPEVVVGTFAGQPLAYYRNDGVVWIPASAPLGLRQPLMRFTTFGLRLVDYDNDGDKDIITANGQVYPDVRQFDMMGDYAQPTVILLNQGGEPWLRLISEAGRGITDALPSRGLAVGDYDNDGDLDLLIANIDRPPSLLRNDGPTEGNVLVVQLEGTTSNRSGIGASVTVRTGVMRQVVEIKSGSGFASQSDLRAYIGLGLAAAADEVTIRWPSGRTDTAQNLRAGMLVTAIEGKELTWRAFVKPAAATRPAPAAP